MGKRAKLQAALENGDQLSTKQIVRRFGYASGNCARKDITRIRDQGVPIGRLYRGNLAPKFLLTGNPRPAIVVIRA